MKQVTIDFTDIKPNQSVHKIIKNSFKYSDVGGFPDFYGENADAFWDCLTGFIETPCEIILKGTSNTKDEFLTKEINLIKKICLRAAADEIWEIKVTIID